MEGSVVVVVVVVGGAGGGGGMVGKLEGDVEDVPGLRRYRGIPDGDSFFFSLASPVDEVEGLAGDAFFFTSSFVVVVVVVVAAAAVVVAVVVLLGSLLGSEPITTGVPMTLPFNAV